MDEYRLIRNSRSRQVRLRLSNDGLVTVSAPLRTPKILIDQFVKQQQGWIERQQQKFKLKTQVNPILDWQEKWVSFLGRLYHFEIDEPDILNHIGERGQKVIISNDTLWVRPITGDPAHLKSTLLNWLKAQAIEYFQLRVPQLSQQMNVKYERLSYRQQTSRWGSCSSKGTLSFNWRLIHFKPEVIDYVIIHELAHVMHMDHSIAFWSLVGRHDRSYKDKVRFLKQQNLLME